MERMEVGEDDMEKGVEAEADEEDVEAKRGMACWHWKPQGSLLRILSQSEPSPSFMPAIASMR